MIRNSERSARCLVNLPTSSSERSLAGAKAAETLARGRLRRRGRHDRRGDRPPVRAAAAVQGLSARQRRAGIDLRAPPRLVRRATTSTCAWAPPPRRSTGPAGPVRLANGESVPYDKLLITTGASPRHLNIPGADLDGVLYLRSVGNSERLGAALRGGGSVVIAGAGWIGLETAAAARRLRLRGHGRASRSAGRCCARSARSSARSSPSLHRSHGVTFRFGEGLSEITGSGKAAAAVTSAGTELPGRCRGHRDRRRAERGHRRRRPASRWTTAS